MMSPAANQLAGSCDLALESQGLREKGGKFGCLVVDDSTNSLVVA